MHDLPRSALQGFDMVLTFLVLNGYKNQNLQDTRGNFCHLSFVTLSLLTFLAFFSADSETSQVGFYHLVPQPLSWPERE